MRINWWDLEVNDKCFNVLDMKPKCVEELTEVITVARFHPTSGHQLVYATSKGTVSTVDTRISAICDYGRGATRKLQSFGMDSFCADSFYSELISSISDVRYSTNDGRYIIARDYLSIKIWDSHMSNKPIKNIPVNNYLRPALTQLYESGTNYYISHLILSQTQSFPSSLITYSSHQSFNSYHYYQLLNDVVL